VTMEPLEKWHDFFMLAGTAAGTLVGLTFVAASIGAGLFMKGFNDVMKAFITPTIIHLSAVLFVCFVVVAPSLSSVELASFCGVIALAGIGYSCSTLFRINSRYIAATSFMDRLWYPLIPAAGYVILAAAILEPLIRSSLLRPSWIAIAVSILLLAGIRNAWAITAWIATQPNRD
jgi:hypothetical protein